jgi:hypothetical protein
MPLNDVQVFVTTLGATETNNTQEILQTVSSTHLKR